MAFEQFPYTSLHDLNLDWLLKTVKDMQGDVEEVKRIIEMADLPEVLRQKLVEMVEDGTLEAVLERVITGTVLTDLDKASGFIPSGEDWRDYQNHTLQVIASWLVAELGSSCVVGTPTTSTKSAFKYSITHPWYKVLYESGLSDFNFSDTINVDGVNYPVTYLTCSAWLSLVTKCTTFGDDPANWARRNGYSQPLSEADRYTIMRNSAQEFGSNLLTAPYTIDFLNWEHTYRQAYLLDVSGCKLRKLWNVNDGWDDARLDKMETGDIIYFANSDPSSDGYYKNIHHCAYYVKSLADLNNYMAHYNVSAVPMDNLSPDKGFVVHCTQATGGSGDYHDVVRINTLRYCAEVRVERDLYVARPYSNAMNSTKAANVVGRAWPMENSFVWSDRSGLGDNWAKMNVGLSQLNIRDVILRGRPLADGDDLNEIDTGFAYSSSETVVDHLENKPSDASSTRTAILVNVIRGGTYARRLQLYADTSGLWYRVRAGNWYSWHKISES